MADDADRATEHIEQELNALIATARGIEKPQAPRRTICPDCGEKLAPHRVPFGYCVPCVEIREARMRWR